MPKDPTATPAPIPAASVLSPKNMVSNLAVLHDGGGWREGDPMSGWSVAKMLWGKAPALGIRWNGGGAEQPLGHPVARNQYPTWFIIPAPLATVIEHAIEALHEGDKDIGKGNGISQAHLIHAIHGLIGAARNATPEQIDKLQNQFSE